MITDFIDYFLRNAGRDGLKRELRGIIPLSARECIVEGRKCLNFSSNNYLALADHPKLKEESVKWTKKYGVGSGASRLVTGTFKVYTELEKSIALWKKTEDALIFGSGYLANIGVIAALADRKTAIFADKLNHASLTAGCRLSDAKFTRYRHNSMEHLGEMLAKFMDFEKKLIISDTVFSMDGDTADLTCLADIAGKNDAFLYLDDAHATGIFGERGEGLSCAALSAGLQKKQLVSMGTFSKAMGSYGAYVACSTEMKEYLVNRCGSFVFTTALPPGVYGAISAAVDLVQTKEYCGIRGKLLERAVNLTAELKNMGFNTGNTSTPIIPVIIGDVKKVLQISQFLMESGILAVAIRPPTVPEETARLRISLNAAHTDNDILFLLDALKQAKSELVI